MIATGTATHCLLYDLASSFPQHADLPDIHRQMTGTEGSDKKIASCLILVTLSRALHDGQPIRNLPLGFVSIDLTWVILQISWIVLWS